MPVDRTTTRLPSELKAGDVIVIHPSTGQAGEWTVVRQPGRAACQHAEILVESGGDRMVIVVTSGVDITVRLTPHEAAVMGLRKMAALLERHPTLPVDEFQRIGITHYVDVGDTPHRIAEVDRIAAELGVEAGRPRTSIRDYEARVEFGSVRYSARANDVLDEPAPTEGGA